MEAVPERVGVKVKGAGEAETEDEVVPVVEVARTKYSGEREKRRNAVRVGSSKFIARSNNCDYALARGE